MKHCLLRTTLLSRLVAILISLIILNSLSAKDLTLDEALNIALFNTGRGGMIDGNLEVAEQTYFAEKIGFYVPEISINGSLPAYKVNERYGYLQGTDTKTLLKYTDYDFDADITLKQNLITGGGSDFKIKFGKKRLGLS